MHFNIVCYSSVHTIHLMYGPEGNSLFCFPESPDVSRDEVQENITTRGNTKLPLPKTNMKNEGSGNFTSFKIRSKDTFFLYLYAN